MLKKRNNKAIAIAMAFVFCLTFLAPAFIAPQSASAATYNVSNVPSVSKAVGQNLGTVVIDFGVLNAGYHQGIIKLPGSFVVPGAANANLTATNISDLTDVAPAPLAASAAVAPVAIAADTYRLTKLSDNQLQFEIRSSAVYQKVKFAVLLTNVTVPNSADAEITASVMKLDGDFTDAAIVVGKTTSGALDVLRSDPPTMTAGVSAPITFTVREDVAGAMAQGAATLKLKLPKGVTWNAGSAVTLFPNVALPVGVAESEVITTSIADPSILSITRNTQDQTAVGNPAVAPTIKRTFTIVATVTIDADAAAFGDIVATVSGASTSNASSVKLGAYKDFGYTLTAAKAETQLTAGMVAEAISDINIKEGIAGSLLNGRTVTMKLPEGVEWTNANFNGTTKAGTFAIAFARSANDLTKATGTIVQGAAKGEIAFEKFEVTPAVDFTGSVEIQFSGSAGINDKVVVGKVAAPVTATAETKDVIIGVQGQAAGKITITETKAEGIKSRFGVAPASLTLTAPAGVSIDKVPTVKVVEGDLSIGTVTKAGGVITIPVRTVSSKASKLEISDIVYNLDRTVPEGDLKINIGGTALDQAAIVNRTIAATVVAAKVVTPAPNQGTAGAVAGQFKINSNIYEVNGVAKVMDAAPYVKSGRTYVPVRYIGLALGVAEADIVWDAASQKVTLTKGDKKVEMTIGSKTITVNGEAKTMDVAPEITSSRTMLPARYVAEGLGYAVGWDPATGTVLVSK